MKSMTLPLATALIYLQTMGPERGRKKEYAKNVLAFAELLNFYKQFMSFIPFMAQNNYQRVSNAFLNQGKRCTDKKLNLTYYKQLVQGPRDRI